MSTSNLISESERTGSPGNQESLREVLDFLVTEEQLGVTLVSAAIKNAPGTPSEAFLPVLRNGVTTEYHHVQALKEAGGKPLTTKYWFPDAALDNGGIGIFETLEVIETIEISLYLIGVSAFASRGDDFGARLCAEAMGTEAVHRALVRFAQGELGKEIGPPNDVGFENYDWPTLGAKEMTAVTPEIVVFIISTNDYPVALNKTLDAAGELAWKAPYTKEVDDMMKVLEGSGRTVLWLGAPVLGDTKQNDAIKELNAVEKEVAKKHPKVVYFDTYALFADADGKYSTTVTDADGKTITARSGDGVHLTMDGANYLARAVFKVVDAQCKVAAQAVTGVTKATIQTPGSTQVAPGSGGSGGNVGTTPPATGSNTATTSPPTATTSAPATSPPATTSAPATTAAPPATTKAP